MSRFRSILDALLVLCLSLHGTESASNKQTRPNIIFMFGDDLGFNEMGYSSCTDTKTPWIDNLAQNEGLILEHNYASKICSPSRSAFISGRYPSTLGLQNLVFNVQYPVSLTRQVSILSEEFQANGYNTHMIGKWHLGYTSWEYTPTYRGFDSFSGFYGGLQYYFSHLQCMDVDCYFDLRINEEKDLENVQSQQYGTFLERDQALEVLAQEKESEDPFFMYLAWQASHIPNEAPSMYRQLYPDAAHEDRNFCQAQTTALDGAVGEVVAYLKTNGMWDDTLIVFSSDNGGQYNRHDNFPLRGFKNTSFEGGIRVPGFVTGGYLNEDRKGLIARDFMVSVVDWYPTLLSAAGIEVGYSRSTRLYQSDDDDTRFDDNGVGTVPLDGKDVWSAIQYGEVSDDISTKSRELLLDLDYTETCLFSSCGALRSGRWKFIRGANMGVNESVTNGTQWLGSFATCDDDTFGCWKTQVSEHSVYCHLSETGCLFNLDVDACEKNDVGDQYPGIRGQLIERLDFYQSQAAPILIVAGMGMDIEDFDPGEKDEKFWGPYKEYEEVTFEEELEAFYQENYPLEMAEDEHMEWRSEPGHEDEAQHGHDPEAGMSALGKVPHAAGRREIVSKLVLAVLSIGLVVMLYFIGRFCKASKVAATQIRGEVAPLLSKEIAV